ncbi:TPA: Leucine-rich repeat-containing protein 43 [Trebouxia sp. C0005]
MAIAAAAGVPSAGIITGAKASKGNSEIGVLRLADQSLTTLPNNLLQLRELYAAANRLNRISDLCRCSHLLLADLAWNNIHVIPDVLPTSLVSLNLSHNSLCNLASTLTTLTPLVKLRDLHLKGNPFCLQPAYLAAVQQALPCLQRFDGKTTCWSKSAASMQSIDTPAKTSSFAADSTDATSVGLQLQICFSQLSVQNTVPGRLPAPDAANEPVPPLYHYYLQLRTADGSLLCSFPIVLTPQEELAQWQAQQAAEPAAASKKAAKKVPAGKGGKADANAADQRNAWYPEGSMSAAVPIAADVSTRDWLRSGMVVQLLQTRTQLSAAAGTTQGQSLVTANGQAALQRCIARGVLQADALLDGAVQECSNKLSLLTELPLFDARGVRLGIQSVQENAYEEASVQIQLRVLTSASMSERSVLP